MPTNDERRRVAARLRRLNAPSMIALMSILDVSGRDMCARLADLIEPEPERTCRNVCEWNIDTFHFTCSECGAEIGGDDWGDSPVFVGDYHERLRYCPNCGARLEDE